MENFIYTLAAAALSGLAFIAYRHPEAYARVSGIINAVFVATVAYLNGWNYAVAKTQILAGQFIPAEKGAEALATFKTLDYSLFQSLGLPFIFYGFHIFLLALPHLIVKEKKADA